MINRGKFMKYEIYTLYAKNKWRYKGNKKVKQNLKKGIFLHSMIWIT